MALNLVAVCTMAVYMKAVYTMEVNALAPDEQCCVNECDNVLERCCVINWLLLLNDSLTENGKTVLLAIRLFGLTGLTI